MSNKSQGQLTDWAQFRFSVIGGLLARPPEKGRLCKELKKLAEQRYRHPVTGGWVHFGASTIERWYYRALNSEDPISALGRKIRSDLGKTSAMSPRLLEILHQQYKDYPDWTYQLHADNLAAFVEQSSEFDHPPSYANGTKTYAGAGMGQKTIL